MAQLVRLVISIIGGRLLFSLTTGVGSVVSDWHYFPMTMGLGSSSTIACLIVAYLTDYGNILAWRATKSNYQQSATLRPHLFYWFLLYLLKHKVDPYDAELKLNPY